MIEQEAPGAPWQPVISSSHTIKTDYLANGTNRVNILGGNFNDIIKNNPGETFIILAIPVSKPVKKAVVSVDPSEVTHTVIPEEKKKP